MTKDSAVPPGADRHARIEQLERKIESLHRSVLEKDVLKGQLPIRARTVEHRGALPEPTAREQRFREASAAYTRAIGAAAPPGWSPANMRVIELDSLRWWVPLIRPDDQVFVERALKHQDFPYRVIAQTREVALGGLMLDIGANTGRMCIPRAILGDVTAAYCAEPDPLNYACLVRNVRDNHLAGLVMPDHLAVGSEDGVVRLERGKSSGGHRVIDPDDPAERDVLEVRSLTLDTWVDQLGVDRQQLAFVKVDVQGSEVHVLRGASRTLAQRHVAWQVEVDLEALVRRGFVADDLFGSFERYFSHFVDLSRRGSGERVRRVSELRSALEYLGGGSEGRTDVLLFSMEPTTAGVEHLGRKGPRA